METQSCDWNCLQMILLKVQNSRAVKYTQRLQETTHITHSLFRTLNRTHTISKHSLLPLTFSSLSHSFRLLCPLPVQINTYCLEYVLPKRERQRNKKGQHDFKNWRRMSAHTARLALRPRRTSFPVQWNNLGVVKC